MNRLRGRIEHLARSLHPLDSRLDDIPVHGYQPPAGAAWRPRAAAVLIPILDRDEPEILLTVRSRHLPRHAGQVSLPGGGRQDDEDFPLQTALRETAEEVGIGAAHIRPLGLLDRFDTITGFRVVPVVALIHGDPEPVPCPSEVDSVFGLPWKTVACPDSYRRHHVIRGRHRWELISMATTPRLVWGATAAILMQLSAVCPSEG